MTLTETWLLGAANHDAKRVAISTRLMVSLWAITKYSRVLTCPRFHDTDPTFSSTLGSSPAVTIVPISPDMPQTYYPDPGPVSIQYVLSKHSLEM